MKPLFFLLLLPFSVNSSLAQSHNTKCMQCKYSKKEKNTKPANSIAARGSDECTCAACNKKEAEETKARQAEQKRLQDAMVKRNQAAREEMQKKIIAEKEKNKSTEVVIVNNPSPTKIVTKPEKEKPVKSLRFMAASSARFFDPDTKEYLECPENTSNRRIIMETFGVRRIAGTNIAEFLHPPETGVLTYYNYPPIYCNSNRVSPWDIIDYECNTLFNDKNIHYIEHFYENWFLIGYQLCDKYESDYLGRHFTELKLYNIKTKKYYPIQIEGEFYRLDLSKDATRGMYYRGFGERLFHNHFYITGQYEESERKHFNYELFYDKITGGKDGWKAAVPILVFKSPDAKASLMIFYMDKSGNFKLVPADIIEYRKYFSREPE